MKLNLPVAPLIKDFVQEYRNQTEYFNMDEYAAVQLIKYAKQRRRGLISLQEYINVRSAIEEQLLHI